MAHLPPRVALGKSPAGGLGWGSRHPHPRSCASVHLGWPAGTDDTPGGRLRSGFRHPRVVDQPRAPLPRVPGHSRLSCPQRLNVSIAYDVGILAFVPPVEQGRGIAWVWKPVTARFTGSTPKSIRSHAASRNDVGYLNAMPTSGGSRPESHTGGPFIGSGR